MATKTKYPCCECSKPTARLHPILGIPLCAECQRNLRDKYRYITKTRAITEYRLKPADLENLRAHKVDNPHYKTAAPMQLYLLSQIQALSRQKWGTTEPYLVTLVGFPDEYLAWLLEDLERLKHLSAEQFQHLIADRLEHMGLNVQLVGHCYRKDGGVDIIAYPQKLRPVRLRLGSKAEGQGASLEPALVFLVAHQGGDGS